MRFTTSGRLALALVSVYLGCNGAESLAPDAAADLRMAAMVSGNQVAPPSNVTAVAASVSAIAIAWQDNSTNESKFEIHRSITGETGAFTLLTSTGAGITAHTDQGVAQGVRYCYRIRGARLTGNKSVYSAFSNTACATTPPPTPPAAPSNAIVGLYSAHEITVRWQDNSSTETGFEIHRSVGGPSGTFSLRGTVSANHTGFGDAGLSAFTEYCYMIRSVQSIGSDVIGSPFSNVTCARTNPPPAFATTAKPTSSGSVLVEWHAVGSTFRIDRSTDGGASWMVAAGTMTDLRSFATPVNAEQAVCYRVVNYLLTYEAEPSNTACTAAPAAPTAVTITVSSGITDVTWSDNSAVEDGYEVRSRVDDCFRDWDGVEYCSGTFDMVVAVLPANATSYRLALPYPYSTVVYAMKDGGYSSGGSQSP